MVWFRKNAGRKRGVGRVMRKARQYRSRGLMAFGNRVGRYIGKQISNKIHTFRKQIDMGFLLETGGAQHKVYNFHFAQLTESPELAEIYDQYKINKVILSFEPQFSGTNANLVAPYQNWMRIVHDYDDVLPLVNDGDYLEYSNCKSKLAVSNRIIGTVLYPKILGQTAIDGGVPVYNGSKASWLSTDYKNINHLGLKILVPTVGLPVGTAMFRVRATMMCSFKNSR